MTRLLTITAIAALMALSGVVVAAQDAPTPVTAEDTVSVEVAGYLYDVDGGEPLTACITETRDDVEGGYATLMVFARQINDAVTPIGMFQTRATAALADAEVGTCLVLTVDDE